ncbi:uncharacterized protein [Montipora capricornis]|uniref:uncharacterized protein n=1 Tax=Montipora capricornis TaxID=246305 RepID=UPI0035F1C906
MLDFCFGKFGIAFDSARMASGKDRILSQGPQRKFLTKEQTTRSVVVTNISHQTSDSAIVIYFQQAKNGGGELDHVHIPQKGKAVITFANIQVAEKTLLHPHKLDGSELKIHRLANKEPIKVFQRVEARLELDPLISFGESRQNMIDALKEIEVESRQTSQNVIILSGSLYQVRTAHGKLRPFASGVKAGDQGTGGSGYNQRVSSSGADPLFPESPNIFEVQPQFMKLLKQVHNKSLREMEHKFEVEIVWDENASQVCVRQRRTSKGNHRVKEGCEEFIDLYKSFLPKVSREVVQLPSEVEETVVDEMLITVQKENPVIFEKVQNSVVVYADEDSIRSYVRLLEEKIRFTLRSSRTRKVTSQGTVQVQDQPLQSFLESKPLLQVLKNGVTLSVCRGDITNVQVDAIVNAANEFLQHGAGVADAIVRKGGSQIQEESNKITRTRGHLNVGEAVATSGGHLPCRYVIHAVGPRWNEHGKKASKSLLRQACLASLNLAALELQLSSIALTAISSGIFGMPKDICAQVVFKAVEEFSESQKAEFSTLRDVRIVIIDEPTISVFSEEFIKRYNPNKASPGTVVNPERPLDEGGQSSMATNPTKENKLLSSPDKEMPCNEKVNPDTAKVKLSGKAASMDQDIYEATLSDTLKNMSPPSEEDKENARSESSLKTEKVDPSPEKSSGSLNNNATGKPPRGKGRGMLALRFKSSSGTEMSHSTLFHGKIAGGETDVNTKNANTGSPAPGLAVTEEEKKLAKQFKASVENDESAEVTELVGIITESSGPNPQDANRSHEPDDKENLCGKTIENSKDNEINNVAKSLEYSQKTADNSNTDGSIQRYPHHSTKTPLAGEDTGTKNVQGDPSHGPESDPGQVNEMTRGDQTKRPNCFVCNKFNAPQVIARCRRDHYFCSSCYEALSVTTEICPQCKKESLSQGGQPTGQMTWNADTRISLPGYNDCGVIMVQFCFDKGIQGPGHPNPGQPYNASTTTCYFPFNREGQEVCGLLKKAFETNLLFTIEKGEIVCNGIELITDRFKGPANYENPDLAYLDRLRGQLAKLGITVPQV